MNVPRQKRILAAIFCSIYTAIVWVYMIYFFVIVIDTFTEEPLGFLSAMFIFTFLACIAGYGTAEFILKKLKKKDYETSDPLIVADDIFKVLCELDKGDRDANRPSAWQDFSTLLPERLPEYKIDDDVRLDAENVLVYKEFIEREDGAPYKAKLTSKGRRNCGIRLN